MQDISEIYRSLSLQNRRLIQLANWIHQGSHVEIIGLSGSGRTQLLNRLFALPAWLDDWFKQLPIGYAALPVDMVNLVEVNEIQLYRLLLRTIYEQRSGFSVEAEGYVEQVAKQNLRTRDLFLLQSSIRELFECICSPSERVVFLFDRFDESCGRFVPKMMNALMALLTGYEQQICFIFGSSEPTVGNKRSGINNVSAIKSIWVDGVDSAEAERIICTTLQDTKLDQQQVRFLAQLTGGFPALIESTLAWYSETLDKDNSSVWLESLYEHDATQAKLLAIWEELTYQERRFLHDFQTVKGRDCRQFIEQNHVVTKKLIQLGVLREQENKFEIFSPLFERLIVDLRHMIRGRVWFNETNDTFYQGEMPLEDLSPRAEAALEFFLQHPYKKCDKDQLIYYIWESPHVTDDSVYQVIRELRRHLEADSRNPSYILNHRSLRGGRYQFFPEGRQNYDYTPTA